MQNPSLFFFRQIALKIKECNRMIFSNEKTENPIRFNIFLRMPDRAGLL
jgi:hypothetical protein